MVSGGCETNDVIHKATSTDQDLNERIYVGETAHTFKKRCGKHNTTFNHKEYRNDTSLSNHIWELQEKKLTYQLTWEILKKVPSYKPGNEH